VKTPASHDPERGQSLVEFSLAFTLFAVVTLALFDFGRAVYAYNGVSQAAREIARTTSVHPGDTLGLSAETASTVNAQRSMVPGMVDPVYACIDIEGSPVTTACLPGDSVQVTVSVEYRPAIPLLNMIGSITLSSSSTVEIQ
jgi:Flp pilus assembly protein TadG